MYEVIERISSQNLKFTIITMVLLRTKIRHIKMPLILHRGFMRSVPRFQEFDKDFFHKNGPQGELDEFPVIKNDLGVQVKNYYKSITRPRDLILPKAVQLKSNEREVEDVVLTKSYAAVDSYSEILEANEGQVPIPGSLVKYKLQGTYMFGVVVREALSKFNPNYNRVLILNMDNKIDLVYSQDIVLHLHGVLDSDWINSLKIPDNRDDQEFYTRILLQDVLRYFLSKVVTIEEQITGSIDILYSQYSDDSSLTSVTMIEATDCIKETLQNPQLWDDLNTSYFQQTVLLAAIHEHLHKTFTGFIVSNKFLYLKATNIYQEYSNNLIQLPVYLVIPSNLLNSLTRFINDVNTPEGLSSLNFFLDNFARLQLSDHKRLGIELDTYFSIWEGSKYTHLIDTLKFQAIYPNDTLQASIKKLRFFEGHLNIDSNAIIGSLKDLLIYNDSTDIWASLGILGGSTNIRKLSVEKGENYHPRLSTASVAPELAMKRDLFESIRQTPFGKSDVIYGITLSDGTNLGISLTQVNTRNYIVNVHLPDLISRLTPSSRAFKDMINKDHYKTLIPLYGTSIPIFGDKIQSLYRYDDTTEDNERTEPLTSLTLSFKFNTYDSNTFKDLPEKVSFHLHDLSRVTIKALDIPTLQEALRLKKNTLAFKLFKSHNIQESKVDPQDEHNLRFIYNVLKSHFSVRNINGAATTSLAQDNQEAHFFLEELGMFVGNLTSSYCKDNEIAVISQAQKLLVEPESLDPRMDEVLITHNNLLLPDFHSNSFFQTLVSRDANGYVSLPAFIIGKNYLTKEEITTKKTKHISYGMADGYVPMLNPFASFATLLNHFQMVCHLQWMMTVSKNMRLHVKGYNFSRKWSYLKGFGYNVHGPMSESILSTHVPGIIRANTAKNHIKDIDYRFWTFKNLEEILKSSNEPLEFECVLTEIGPEVPELGHRIAKCFVKQLQIETDLIISNLTESNLTIGSLIKADRVLFLSPIDFVCVLGEADPF